MAARGISGAWSAQGLAQHIVAVTQGAFILAKASGEPAIAQASLDHLRRYIETLFAAPVQTPAPPSAPSTNKKDLT
jgi:TetR/AcrR family transcriptional repressor of nem operon